MAMNRFLVGSRGGRIVIGNPPASMSADDAIELAAFLVAMAEPFALKTFNAVLEEVQSS